LSNLYHYFTSLRTAHKNFIKIKSTRLIENMITPIFFIKFNFIEIYSLVDHSI